MGQNEASNCSYLRNDVVNQLEPSIDYYLLLDIKHPGLCSSIKQIKHETVH